jgi:hypothetical protein
VIEPTFLEEPPMPDHPASTELLATSRLIGADVRFLQLVELVASKLPGGAVDAPARARIEVLHGEFRAACASIFERHLGREQALASLGALESAPVQRYLVARQLLAPALEQQLAALKQRMGNIEV